jgi:hypothetical protein
MAADQEFLGMFLEAKMETLAQCVVGAPKQLAGRSTQLHQEFFVNRWELPTGVLFKLPNFLRTCSLQILFSAFRQSA